MTFGVLFNDDRCANIFEALVGTLKAAKKKKVVAFQAELLLQGVHDNVEIVLLQEWGQSEDQTASGDCGSHRVLPDTELLTSLPLSFCFQFSSVMYKAQYLNSNVMTKQILSD